jgi:hypothetical protein
VKTEAQKKKEASERAARALQKTKAKLGVGPVRPLRGATASPLAAKSWQRKPNPPPIVLAGIAEDIKRDGFAFRSGKDVRSIMRMRGLDAWPAFASSWDDLGLDVYMGDGGRYRRRRFAAFGVSNGTVTRKPHQPHYQSRDHNPLNGGIERWFTPVSDGACANDFMLGILRVCTEIFRAASPDGAKGAAWHAETHQFRIETGRGQLGLPTPEGAHRDGVEWVCVLLISRRNVLSGVTQIFDPRGESLGEFTLTDPLDAVFLDDRRVLHGVTPITRSNPGLKASRDVLVLTFRREELVT